MENYFFLENYVTSVQRQRELFLTMFYWVTGLFLQPRHASGTLYHLIFALVFVPQNSSLFSKLILCHRFSMTNFVVSVFLCVVFCFVFVLFLVLLRLEHPPSYYYYYYYYYIILSTSPHHRNQARFNANNCFE